MNFVAHRVDVDRASVVGADFNIDADDLAAAGTWIRTAPALMASQ